MRTLLSLYLLLLRFDFDELSECEGEDLVGYTSTKEYEGLRWVLSRISICAFDDVGDRFIKG